MTSQVVLHLPTYMAEAMDGPRPPDLYGRIANLLGKYGVKPVIAPQIKPEHARDMNDGNLHIAENGAIRAEGWLNAATAYLAGFYHVDPVGIQAASGIAQMSYNPSGIEADAARAYAAGLRQRFVAQRRSRYRQDKERQNLPQGCLAVLLQGPAPHRLKQAHFSNFEMVRAVCAAANGRAVIVKPHPKAQDYGQATLAELRAEGHSFETADANIHDILAACCATVSINSGAAAEGFMHQKPAILCGTSDLHHFAETVKNPDDMGAALDRVLSGAGPDFDRALHWYFGLHCLDAAAPDFEARLLLRFESAGFPLERLRRG